ncbi:MAG: hypothetical protein KDK10_13295 [Maritimibacter sp.]|nr:hypothetical protein [Maritimibacter sp.]
MLRQEYIDRVCSQTLSGRFGVRIVSPTSKTEFTCLAAEAAPQTEIRSGAVRITAACGAEQGTL